MTLCIGNHNRHRPDHIDNVRVCCPKRKLEDILYKPIMQCINCGAIHPRQIDRRICYLCNKVIQADISDVDEFERLIEIGELEIRTYECSFDVERPLIYEIDDRWKNLSAYSVLPSPYHR